MPRETRRPHRSPPPCRPLPCGANPRAGRAGACTDDGGTNPDNPPAATAPVINSFQVTPTSVTCSVKKADAPASGLTGAPLTITWSSTGGAKAWLGVDTDDAEAGPYTQVVADGGQTSIDYQCFDDHTYTLTVVSADGQKVSQTVTVTNIGDAAP
jgi:hypothetical protein